jgi:hypothetical protein
MMPPSVNRPFNCERIVKVIRDAIAGVMVLSEVAKRLMMMSGSDASTCGSECGRAAASRFNEVVTTTADRQRARRIADALSIETGDLLLETAGWQQHVLRWHITVFEIKLLPGISTHEARLLAEREARRVDADSQLCCKALRPTRTSTMKMPIV